MVLERKRMRRGGQMPRGKIATGGAAGKGGAWAARLVEAAFVVHDAAEGFVEVLHDFHGDHDGVAAAADFLGDFEDAAAVIFLEVEEELLAFVEDFFG